MGFISGVITGIAIAAAGAAWYMSRSGERFREEYKVEARLGEIGDQFGERTKEVQAQMGTQIADLRSKAQDAIADATNGSGEHLDDAAADAVSDVAADAEAATTKVKKAAKDVAES